MPWQLIEEQLRRPGFTLSVPYDKIFAVAIPNTTTTWLVGPYASLTTLATALRTDERLWETLTKLGVRLGLRETDTPSTNERQKRYGPTVTGVPFNTSFAGQRKKELAEPVVTNHPFSLSRRTDRETNVLSFWQTQTPQSHHIVEYNNLRDIKASKPDMKGNLGMDYNQLPAVLLAAEFHQRYISAILRTMHGMNETKLRQEMPGTYRTLYNQRSALFEPLWQISKVILTRAGLSV